MGYEVLDSADTGDSSATSQQLQPPVEAVALDDLPLPPSQPVPGRGPVPGRLLWGGAGRPSRRVTAGVAAALVAGIVSGSLWGGHHAADVQRARELATVQAFALAVGVNVHDADQSQTTPGRSSARVADFTVRVFNMGTRSLTVDTSRAGGALVSATEPLVTVVTGSGTVPPGHDAEVRVRVPLECSSRHPIRLTLSVRSPGGRTYRLTPRPADQNGDQLGLDQSNAALCSFDQPDAETVRVQLAGTMTRPTIELTNPSERPVTVTLDPGSPVTRDAGRFLSFSTSPALPVTVAPGRTTTLRLRVQAKGCRNAVSQLADGVGYLQLQLNGGSIQGGPTGVDVTALLGAAIERACR